MKNYTYRLSYCAPIRQIEAESDEEVLRLMGKLAVGPVIEEKDNIYAAGIEPFISRQLEPASQ